MRYQAYGCMTNYVVRRRQWVAKLAAGERIPPPSQYNAWYKTRYLKGRLTNSSLRRWYKYFRWLVPELPFQTIRNDAFKAYHKEVWRLTKALPLHQLHGVGLRGKDYHLDHVLSIGEGFRLRLPPETLACLSNLRVIPAAQNLSKATRSVYTNLFNEDISA